MNIEVASGILAWLAVTLQLAGHTIYVRSVLRSSMQPNTASWLIWAYGGVLEAASYIAMSGDWVKWLLPIACNFACVVTFALLLGKGRFAWLSSWEWICLGIDMMGLIVWWHWRSATWAHLVMQIGVPISFVPIFLSVWRNPANEHPLPWVIWSAAYFLGTVTVVLRWQEWPEVVFSLNNLICHALIGVLCFRAGARATM